MNRTDGVTGSFAHSASQLPLEQAHFVDEVCDTFEAKWQSGERPDILAAVLELAEPVRSAALQELIPLDAFYRGRAGEAPTAADYAPRFPEVGNWEQVLPPPDRAAEGNDHARFGGTNCWGKSAAGAWGWFTRRGRCL